MRILAVTVILMLVVLVFVLALAPAPTPVPPQEPAAAEDTDTIIEVLLAKRGNLILKEIHPVGIHSGDDRSEIRISTLIVSLPGGASERLRGMRFEVIRRASVERSRLAVLDFEDAVALGDAIAGMLEVAEEMSKGWWDYTEVFFKTQNNFQVGVVQNGKIQKAYAKVGALSEVVVYLPAVEKLRELRADVLEAVSWLKER